MGDNKTLAAERLREFKLYQPLSVEDVAFLREVALLVEPSGSVGTTSDNKTLPERAREHANRAQAELTAENAPRAVAFLARNLRELAVALEAAEKDAAGWKSYAIDRLVCSWCGEDEDGDSSETGASPCCSCDLTTAASLPVLLQEARKEAQEAIDGAFDEQARLVAVEAERDEALTLAAALSLTEGGSDFTTRVLALNDDTLDAASAELDRVAADLLLGDRVKVLAAEFTARAERLIAAEARVAALEAENAELKGLKAGGDRVARAEADLLEAEIRAFLLDVRALVADHWSGCLPEREAAIAAAPYVDAQVFTEDVDPSYGPPLGPRDPDWLAPLLSLTAAVRPQTDTPEETNKALHATWKATERELAEARGVDWMPTSNFSATLDAMRARGLDAWVTSIEMYLGSTAYGYVQYPFIERAQAAEARCRTYEEALRDAESVCETLPGKLTVEPANIEGALTEIEWLAIRIAAVLASSEKRQDCICPRFRDLPEGTIIADLTCPIHGVDGTDPGDVLPASSVKQEQHEGLGGGRAARSGGGQ